MMLPDEVRIGPQVYTVIPDPDIAAEDNEFGSCNRRRLEIRIDSNAHPSRQYQTLIHEALEAINFEYHIQLNHDQIEQLEAALRSLILDNPNYF